MTREEFLFDISDLPKDGYKTLYKILSGHDASQRALIEEQAKEIAKLREALSELHAQVQGECPSLLNEDSGGDATLALDIESLLKEPA